MTTTAPALPAWEAESTRHRPLPPATAESVNDPAYLAARVAEALEQARAAATGYHSDRAARESLELHLLRDNLEGLRRELRLHSAAADEFLTVLEAVAPGVRWRRGYDSFVGQGPYRSPLEVAESAARALRLGERKRLNDRLCYWVGHIEGWRVQINHYTVG